MAGRAWTWLQTGLNYSTLDAGAFDTLDGYWTFFPVLPTLIHAAAIQVGGLSLATLRLASLLAGVILLMIVGSLTREFGGSRAAQVLAVLLVALSFPFTMSAHFVRPDIFVAVFGFGAVALNLKSRRQQLPALDLLSGMLLAAAFEVHVNAVVYGPVILALFLLHEGRHIVRSRGLLMFAIGLGAGLGIYAWLHVLRYPATFAMMGRGLSITHLPPIATGQLGALIESALDTGEFLLFTTFGADLIASVRCPLSVAIWFHAPATAGRRGPGLHFGVRRFGP